MAGVESSQSMLPRLRSEAPLVKRFVDFLGANTLTRAIVRRVAPFLVDTGMEATKFNLQALDEVNQYWRPNSLLLVVSNHQSHADQLAILKVVQEVRNRIPEMGTVYVPISATLENGMQSGVSRTFYHELALPTFERNNIAPVYVTTPNDRHKRGVRQTREEVLQEIERIKQVVKIKNSAYLVLAEGTVQPGRHKKDGSINGMVKVTGSFFRSVIEAAKTNNREVICIPVGVNGTHRLLSAEHVFLTSENFVAIVRRLLRRKVITLAEVTAGSPFIISSEVNPRELNDSIMRDHVAPLLPLEAQGIHKKVPETIAE